jgi:hypothetical protein
MEQFRIVGYKKKGGLLTKSSSGGGQESLIEQTIGLLEVIERNFLTFSIFKILTNYP